MINYYKELNIDPHLSFEEILVQLNKETRKWFNRTNAADIVQRQKAELKMKLISDAKAIFQSEESKARYDQDLANSKPAAEPRQAAQPKTNNQELDRMIRQAYNLRVSGQIAQSKDLALKAIAIDESRADAWAILGDCQKQLGNIQPAVDAFKRSLQLKPDNFSLAGDLALLYLDNKYPIEARTVLDPALSKDPDNIYLKTINGKLLMSEEKHLESIQLLESIVEEDPSNILARDSLAMSYVAKAFSFCHHNNVNDMDYLISEEASKSFLSYINKAKKYSTNPAVNKSLVWGENALKVEFDSKNKKLFAIPLIIFMALPNLAGIIAAGIISYIIYKSSMKAGWEVNRELVLGENVTAEKAKVHSEKMLKDTSHGLKNLKNNVKDKMSEFKDD